MSRESLIKELDEATRYGDLQLAESINKEIEALDRSGGQKSGRSASSPLRDIAGVGDAALQTGASLLAAPFAGYAGLISLLRGQGIVEAGDTVRGVMDRTYKARTPEGRDVSEGLGSLLSMARKPQEFVGDVIRGNKDLTAGPQYTAYDWGKSEDAKPDTQGSGDLRDLIASTVEIAPDIALTLYGVGKPSWRQPPSLPQHLDPRVIHANRRIRSATEDIPVWEAAKGSKGQDYAARHGQFLAPSQALEREFPTLSALEAEIRGSSAPNAKLFREKLADQPRQAMDLGERVVRQTAPYNDSVVAAEQLSGASKRAIGSVERIPNDITAALYRSADQNPGVIPAADVNSILAQMRATQRANIGNTEYVSGLEDLIGRINAARGEIRPDIQRSLGRPLMLDEVPLPSNIAVNVARSFSTGNYKDYGLLPPSIKGRIEAQLGEASGALTDAAGIATPDLARATAVQRALRPDFQISRFDPLERASRGGGDAVTYINRQLGNNKVDPAAFRTAVQRISEADPNAMRDAVGFRVKSVYDEAFKPNTATGKFTGSEGIKFADDLIGTNNKREAFRISLEEAAKGTNSKNPAAHAEGIIRTVELIRDLSKEVGVDIGRGRTTAVNPTDVARIATMQPLMSRSGMINTVRSFINRFSDDIVAGMMNDPRSIELLIAAGKSKRGSFQSNSALLNLIGAYEGAQATALQGAQGE